MRCIQTDSRQRRRRIFCSMRIIRWTGIRGGKNRWNVARRENRPIFLSVGYSTCYWCHVMERECFENEAIAAEMNRAFVNIKVDREERPDVDQLYMTARAGHVAAGGVADECFPDA